MKRLVRFPVVVAAASLLAACAGHSGDTLTLDGDDVKACAPLQLVVGQTLILSLPSDPTSGYRWSVVDGGGPLLKSLGPEVYSNPKSDETVGEGLSTWRFQVVSGGAGHLRLAYRQPWDSTSPPSQTVDCALEAQ